ncbi:MAG: signal peptidase I [bacterium]
MTTEQTEIEQDEKKGRGPGEREHPQRSPVRETVELVVLALVLALVLRTFMVQAFRIPTGSMEDTLLVGDFILVDKITYGAYVDIGVTEGRLPGLREPRSGDIVVFRYPLDPSKDFVKRLIAGPGQTVRITDREIYVDGELMPDPPRAKHIDPRILPPSYSNRDNFGPITVPRGQYFFMGDNRENSKDSREWGYVPEEYIKGRAFLIYLSWKPDPTIPWFNIFARIRWSRMFDLVH